MIRLWGANEKEKVFIFQIEKKKKKKELLLPECGIQNVSDDKVRNRKGCNRMFLQWGLFLWMTVSSFKKRVPTNVAEGVRVCTSQAFSCWQSSVLVLSIWLFCWIPKETWCWALSAAGNVSSHLLKRRTPGKKCSDRYQN